MELGEHGLYFKATEFKLCNSVPSNIFMDLHDISKEMLKLELSNLVPSFITMRLGYAQR